MFVLFDAEGYHHVQAIALISFIFLQLQSHLIFTMQDVSSYKEGLSSLNQCHVILVLQTIDHLLQFDNIIAFDNTINDPNYRFFQ